MTTPLHGVATERDGGKAGRYTQWRGQSMVELALIMPLLALILVGTVDLGRAFFAYNRLTNVVKEGAIFGVYYPAQITDSGVGSNIFSADPYNIVYRAKQESANSAGVADTSLIITISASSGSDVVCYQGRSTTLLPSASTFAGDCSKASAGDTIQVRAKYNFYPITSQVIGFLGKPFVMRKSVRMVILS